VTPTHETTLDTYEDVAARGEWPPLTLDLRPPPPTPSLAAQLTSVVAPLKSDDLRRMRATMLERLAFSERYSDSVIEHDLIGLLRHLPDGRVERYSEKLAREMAKGRSESAAFGLGRVGDQRVVVFAMDWDFFAGSFGTVSGEKFQMAVDLATSKKLPLVGIYSSSGVRQHENYAGLVQMSRAVYAVATFRERSAKPYLSVLLGQVWGGISASVAPLGDVIVAVAGTEYGFSGPNVIEAYEGRKVEPGSQRVEVHATRRNVDVVVPDEDAAALLLGRLLDVARPRKRGRRAASPPEPAVEPPEAEVDADGGPPSANGDGPTPEDLYARYQALVRSGTRPDARFFAEHVFTDTVALSGGYAADGRQHHPAITAHIGRLGPQPFLVIGTQPSYEPAFDGVKRIPASPTPADYRYLERMLDMGTRWKLPAVFLADTLGARPTLEAEHENQMHCIANALARGLRYRWPVLTVVIGALGSGGGLSVAPNADYIAMLDDSLAFVAEARSAASILYKTAEPTRDQVLATLTTMRATAHDQHELRLVDEVIPSGPSASHTATRLRAALTEAYRQLQGLSPAQLENRRRRRIRRPGGLKVRHGAPPTGSS